MKLKPHQRVDYETAKRRVVECLLNEKLPVIASWIGSFIWPGNEMKGQGLGAAASRILKRMTAEGLVRWTVSDIGRCPIWGYILTKEGKRYGK